MPQLTALEHSIPELMAKANVPGLALAMVKNGEVKVHSFGKTQIDGAQPVSESTVFSVASLSKPLVAYVALQLVDSGALELDRPLSGIVNKGVAPHVASAPITARSVLTHTSGLPNLRGAEPMKVYFPPGSWFSYSSVGFAYLQMALEAVADMSLESLAKKLAFEPLGMYSSSFVWNPQFSDNVAIPHDDAIRLEKDRPASAQASYSLQTTAADYGRFMAAVLGGFALNEATRRQWLTPAVMVPRGDATHLGDAPPETEQDIGWGLGWGIETARGTFFQWGKMDGIRTFAMGSPSTQSALVILTNSNRGLRLMDVAVESTLPGEHPALAWLRTCVTE